MAMFAASLARLDACHREAMTVLKTGEYDAVMRALLSNPLLAKARDETGRTLLHSAVLHDQVTIARLLLLKGGADPNAKAIDGNTPLHLAVSARLYGMTRLLLEEGADPNIQNLHGRTPLFLLCTPEKPQVAGSPEYLNSQVDLSNEFKSTGEGAATKGRLFQEAAFPQKHFADLLLAYRADLNVQDNKGASLAHSAVGSVDIPFLRWLLEHGANPNQPTQVGNSPLHIAAGSLCCEAPWRKSRVLLSCPHPWSIPPTPRFQQQCADLTEVLLDNGADPNLQNKHGWTALHAAAAKDLASVVYVLIENQADVSIKEADGWTALDIATNNDQREAVTEFEEISKDLLRALSGNVSSRARMLIPSMISAEDERGYTPLHFAAAMNDLATVKLCLHHGMAVTKTTHSGSTPIHLAALNGADDVVQFFIDKGYDFGAKDINGRTAFHLAADNGQVNIIKMLHSNNITIQSGDKDAANTEE